jgi:nucleotide-binding universal stress UspA family protein
MIRTVTIRAGGTKYARASQNMGFEIAKRFEARLRVAMAWRRKDDSGEGKPKEPVEGAEGASSPEVEGLVKCASEQGIRAEAAYHGEGSYKGLIHEAHISDLLILGLPTEAAGQVEKDAGVLREEEMPILRKAECSILTVPEEHTEMQNIVVSYQGGEHDKTALRLAGWMGEKFDAKVHVVTVMPRQDDAAQICALGASYLEAFKLADVNQVSSDGTGATTTILMRAIENLDADMMLLGSDTWNVFEGVFMGKTAEQLVNATNMPVCIAR